MLVVDDEPLLRVITEAWLTADGHQVATVPNGAAALQQLQTDPFDLMITDKAMPDWISVIVALIATISFIAVFD